MSELDGNAMNAPPTPASAPNEIEVAKGTAWLSYLWILWLIPLLTLKDNPFAKFHVKQGIMFTLYEIAIGIVGGVIPFLGWFVILPVGGLIMLILAVMGVVKAVNGEYWKAPFGIGTLAAQWLKF